MVNSFEVKKLYPTFPRFKTISPSRTYNKFKQFVCQMIRLYLNGKKKTQSMSSCFIEELHFKKKRSNHFLLIVLKQASRNFRTLKIRKISLCLVWDTYDLKDRLSASRFQKNPKKQTFSHKNYFSLFPKMLQNYILYQFEH